MNRQITGYFLTTPKKTLNFQASTGHPELPQTEICRSSPLVGRKPEGNMSVHSLETPWKLEHALFLDIYLAK